MYERERDNMCMRERESKGGRDLEMVEGKRDRKRKEKDGWR